MNEKQIELPNGLTILLNGRGDGASLSLTVPVGHSNAPLGLAALFEQVVCQHFSPVAAVYGGTITSYFDECDDKDMLPALLYRLLKMVKFRDFQQHVIDEIAESIAQHTRDLAPVPKRKMKRFYKYVAFEDGTSGETTGWDPEGYIGAVTSYKVQDLQNLANTYFTGNNMILSISGEFLGDEKEERDILELVTDWFGNIAAGDKKPIVNGIYSGGCGRLEPVGEYRQFMLGWDISNLHNIAEANVLMSMLKGRLERAFIGFDVDCEVKIAGYYGFRTLRVSVSSQTIKDVNNLIDIVCANVKRLRTELATDYRMETSRRLAIQEKLAVFSQPQDRSIEVAWQVLGRGSMYDINERLNRTGHVTAQDVQEIAQEIFSGVLTYVVYAPSDVYSYDEVKAKL